MFSIHKIAAATALVLASVTAQAIPFTSGSDPLFNFDFTGQTPAPPYTSVTINLDSVTGLGNGQTLSVIYFLDLYGTNPALAISVGGGSGPPRSIDFGTMDADYIDGLFSVRLSLNTGSADFAEIRATATNGNLTAQIAYPAVQSVPEPASIALVGLALVGLGFVRRRTA